MKVLVRKAPLSRFLQWAQRGLFAGAILLLGYSGFVVADAWIFQVRETAELARFIPDRPAGDILLPATIGPDGLIGRIEILRLGVSVIVVEGTAHRTFRRAAGHIAGTALPGQPGNVGIAGHRDTFFRPLRNIQADDLITLTTPRGEYRYRVVSTKVVNPSDVAVLDSDENEILTLVTCYPFYYVGSAPKRFIVRAARVT
ncbi:MAG: sortase family protein [Bryobacterales bacterium]|nr:sortase family protein [Bryobacterales bacterium]